MPRDRFVRPDTITLPLSDGDFIVVKKRLSAGEFLDAQKRMYVWSEGGDLKVDPRLIGLTVILSYLIDWSLTRDGQPFPLRQLSIDEVEAAVRALEYDDFREIRKAIEEHEQRQDALREEEKKTTPDGAIGSRSISNSPVGAGGPSIGSATSTPTNTPSYATT